MFELLETNERWLSPARIVSSDFGEVYWRTGSDVIRYIYWGVFQCQWQPCFNGCSEGVWFLLWYCYLDQWFRFKLLSTFKINVVRCSWWLSYKKSSFVNGMAEETLLILIANSRRIILSFEENNLRLTVDCYTAG